MNVRPDVAAVLFLARRILAFYCVILSLLTLIFLQCGLSSIGDCGAFPVDVVLYRFLWI